MPRTRIHTPADQTIPGALPGRVLPTGSSTIGHIAASLTLIYGQQIGQRLGLMAARHIARLLAIELAALGEAALLHVAALQIVAAGCAAHVTGALCVLRLLRGRADAGLVEGQCAGTTDAVVIARVHSTLIQRRTLGLARIQTAQEGSSAALDGQWESSGAVVGQRAGFLARGQRGTWLRLALHLLQLACLSIGAVHSVTGVTTPTDSAARLRIASKSRGAEHAAG